MKQPLSLIPLAFAVALIAVQVEASPLPIDFISTGLVPVNPLLVPGGSFAEPGLAGTLNLDPSVPSTDQVNTAQLTFGPGTSSFQTGAFDLSFLMTLGGITDTLTQHAVWGTGPTGSAVLSFEASNPVQFGSWSAVLQPFVLMTAPGGSVSAPVMADFTDPSPSPVPEPASIVLLASGLIGTGVGRWRKRSLVA